MTDDIMNPLLLQGETIMEYEEIQEWIRGRYGWTPKTCWIAHCKELAGLPLRTAHNRRNRERKNPCPLTKREAIFSAFLHSGMI